MILACTVIFYHFLNYIFHILNSMISIYMIIGYHFLNDISFLKFNEIYTNAQIKKMESDEKLPLL